MRSSWIRTFWLSAIVFPGLCAELVVLMTESGHEILTSELVREEVHDVLQRKFARHRLAMTRFDWLWSRARCVADASEPDDDADVQLVHAASTAAGGPVRHGRPAHPGWTPPRGVQIVSPRQEWAILAAEHHIATPPDGPCRPARRMPGANGCISWKSPRSGHGSFRGKAETSRRARSHQCESVPDDSPVMQPREQQAAPSGVG